MSYILIAILIYFAYQFIFKLVIPVYQASRRFKKGFREMHDRMQEQVRKQQGPAEPVTPKQKQQGPSKSDYIEFEEIK
jgi:hypothetical protein